MIEKKYNHLPESVSCEYNSICISWFQQNFFIFADYNEDNTVIELTKYPGPLIIQFKTMEECVNHLFENENSYFKTETISC
jgi:hypothetical protein